MPAKKKSSVPAKKNGTQVAIPDYLRVPKEETGVDSMTNEHVVQPRINIAQKMTSRKSGLVCQDGNFYNSVTKQDLGPTIFIIPLLFYTSRVWFRDKSMLGSCFIDANTKEEVWIGDEKECKDNWDLGIDSYNYLVVTYKDLQAAINNNEVPIPCVFSCKSAAISDARKNLNTRIQMNAVKGLPIYAEVVKVTTYEKEFNDGDAFMPKFIMNSQYVTKQQFNILRQLHQNCKRLMSQVEVHAETAEDLQNTKKPKNKKADNF